MRRVTILAVALAVPFSGPLLAQEQTGNVAPAWVFAHAQTATRLVALGNGLAESQARRLVKAICPSDLRVAPVHLITAKQTDGSAENPTYEYEAGESVTVGDHCLLVDSASADGMFLWGGGPEDSTDKRVCVMGFPEAAEALAGRKVDSCYFLGGHGTGSVELVEYQYPSRKERLAALMVDDFPQPGDHKYWIIKFPAGEKGWKGKADGNLHPEQFQYLFTIVDDATSQISFIAIEWDGPDGAYLTLFRPVGNELRPVLTSVHSTPQVIAQE